MNTCGIVYFLIGCICLLNVVIYDLCSIIIKNQSVDNTKDIIVKPLNHTNTVDITAITHSSNQRLFYLPHILKRWDGPLSITMYLKSDDDEKELIQYLSDNHLGNKITFTYYKTQNATEYPYNKLRNLSIQKVKTSHYWVMDMDIWPATNLYHTLLNLDKRYLNDEYLAVIIPAFEYQKDMSNCTDFENCVKQEIPNIPDNMNSLIECIERKKCDEFRKKNQLHNYFSKYWYNDSPQKLLSLQCFINDKQEPYVMVKRSSHLPLFDERFVNYGKDKISWIETLRYMGYQFAVLKNSFVIDVPHPLSKFKKDFYSAIMKKEKWSTVELYKEYLGELRKQKDNSLVYYCT